MYENLAAKYRPQTLNEVLGQEAVKTTLTNAIKLGRVAHSYVFYGPRGCGKTTIARILAKTLNCHNPDKDGNPCGKCPSCLEIADGKSIDVLEIDAASNSSVAQVRDVIVDKVDFVPSRDRYKIYILDEVHRFSVQAFDALLKTIEEPPAHVIFIMATTEQNKLPPTIISRSQCFRFRPISVDDIEARLKEVAASEKIKIDSNALALIAGSADGALRDALTLLDRAASFCSEEIKGETLASLLGQPGPEIIRSLALSLVRRDPVLLHSSFDKLTAGGYDITAALKELRNLFSEAMLASYGLSKDMNVLKFFPEGTDKNLFAKLGRKVNIIIRETDHSDAVTVAAELALFTLIDIPQDLSSLVSRLEGLEIKLSAGGSSVSLKDDSGARPVQSNSMRSYTPVLEEKHGSAKRQFQAPRAPVPERIPDAAVSVAADGPEEKRPPENTGEINFAEGWRILLARLSQPKPYLYNTLISSKTKHGEDGSLLISCRNQFESGRVSESAGELELMLRDILKTRISVKVSYAGKEEAAGDSAGKSKDDSEPPYTGFPKIKKSPEIKNIFFAHKENEVPEASRKPAAQDSSGEVPELADFNDVFKGNITSIKKIK